MGELSITGLATWTGTAQTVETLALIWDDRCKPRQRLTTDQGTTVLLALPRGTILQDGDCLWDDGQRAICVRAQAEPVLIIPFRDPVTLGKVAHHLGNWHRPAQIDADGTIAAQWDPPLEEWCQHHGIAWERQERPFHANVRGHSH
ncbi:MAG: urease accessory protein UreE [Thermostichales cyanobacterium SZTDM-1c_bins_54]